VTSTPLRPNRRAVLAGLAALGLALAAGPARAAIPNAEKIADAVAEANELGGRAEPLWIDVKLRIGDSAPVASGVLATHPTGLARLELKSSSGFVERHLLQGEEYTASRDGQLLDGGQRPFLPPVFLLQAVSGAALRAALGSYGVDARKAVLGRVEEHDCYVLGGRLPRAKDGSEQHRASVWVDLLTYEVVRIDRSDGVRFRLGPFQAFGDIRAPRWIRIESPGQPPARLELERVAPANAPAAAFGMDWLTAPLSPAAAAGP
jgi:hypothetical protein